MPCCADSKCTACEMSQHGCPERLSNRSKGFQEDGAGQQTMEVLVETLTGTAFEMTVSPSDTVFAIKSKIFRVEGIPVSQQHLVYNLQELDDASSLGERGIGDGARLRLVLGMRGGPVATRRLALPPPSDIDALLDCNREDGEWGSGGWKVTVLVFRDGERVNMVRVRENRDGTYSPLDHNKYGSTPRAAEAGAGARGDNAVTLAKMLELRRRMEGLALARRRLDSAAAPSVMHKTRSEESLAGECSRCSWRAACSLPAIAARADSERDVHARPDADRYQPPRWPPARLSPALAPVPADCSWRSGSVWSLGAGAGGGMFSSSTSALESLRVLPSLARAAHCDHLHLSDDGLHLASTTASPSQPPAAPARPAAARPAPAPAPAQKAPEQAPAEEAPPQAPAAPAPARPRCGQCRKRLSIATLHLCRCGGQYCAPHRYAEVHGCAYDYKADASRSLQRANPRVAAPKLPRI